MKFSIKFSIFHSHLLKKYLMENFIFCAVSIAIISVDAETTVVGNLYFIFPISLDSVDLDEGEIPKKEPIVIKTTVKFEEVYNPLEELGK